MGDCWHLALALHRMTGWPFIFTAPADSLAPVNDPDYWEHAAVLLPDGRVLDIEGAHEREAWLARWGSAQQVVTDEPTAARIIELTTLDEGALRLYRVDTRRVARRLLDAHAGAVVTWAA